MVVVETIKAFCDAAPCLERKHTSKQHGNKGIWKKNWMNGRLGEERLEVSLWTICIMQCKRGKVIFSFLYIVFVSSTRLLV